MLKRPELDGVAGWVEEEHGGLFAGLALEANMRLDDEFGACGGEAIRKFAPSTSLVFAIGHSSGAAWGASLPVTALVRPLAKLSIRRTQFHALTVPAERDELVVEREAGCESMIRVVREAYLTAKQTIHRCLPCGATPAHSLNEGSKRIGINAFVEG